jgi:hypothetical protein
MSGVALGIEQSSEAHGVFVDNLYLQLLGRAAGTSEQQSWVNAMLQGATEEQIEAGILASTEFAAHGQATSDQQFIQALYQDLLNRTASNQEVQGWMHVLATAGRSGVALDVLQSREYRTDVVTALYSTLLHRNPDSAGLNFWVSLNGSLENVRAGIEASSEFFNDVM